MDRITERRKSMKKRTAGEMMGRTNVNMNKEGWLMTKIDGKLGDNNQSVTEC